MSFCLSVDAYNKEKAKMLECSTFSEGDYVVYPTHGVGRVVSIEQQRIAGCELELFVITFDRDRMTLRVPVPKARKSGLRKLSSSTVMESALTTLRSRANGNSNGCRDREPHSAGAGNDEHGDGYAESACR